MHSSTPLLESAPHEAEHRSWAQHPEIKDRPGSRRVAADFADRPGDSSGGAVWAGRKAVTHEGGSVSVETESPQTGGPRMKSPFPGMDPYLERHWGDVHASLVTYARDQIQPRLPGDLRARMQERVVIQPPTIVDHPIFPDVRVVERARLEAGERGVAVAEPEVDALAEPLVFRVSETAVERFIEIREARSDDRVITVIEVLSPSNKRAGEGRSKYERKRDELADAGVSLVEIDLLRGCDRHLGDAYVEIPKSHQAAYAACVHRGWRYAEYEIYAFPLRQRLPKFRIPLRESDPDVILDLQAIVDQTYANGAYDDMDYAAPLYPPLDPDDAAWADALLREKGLR